MTIPETHKKELYAYIFGILKNKHCHLLRLNGIGNHVHILLDLHPSIALASLVRDLKLQSGKWMKENESFKDFDGWNEGYYAHTIGENEITACKEYIISQEKHHLSISLMDEMANIAAARHIDWDPRDWQ